MSTKESNIKLSKPIEDPINEIKPTLDKFGRAYATGREKPLFQEFGLKKKLRKNNSKW